MNDQLKPRQRKGLMIVTLYPFIVIILGILVNWLILGVQQNVINTPSSNTMTALIIAATLLVINHSWIMTATERVRVRYQLYATPEEWSANEKSKDNASKVGVEELERVHNAHRNTTENTLYFVLLSIPFIFSTPSKYSVTFWLLSFAIARLGYTYSYLSGKDNLRGLFMTVSLLSLYGITSYCLMSLFV